MSRVEVTIPAMLATLVGEERTFQVDGETVRDVLHELCVRHPELRVHLFDEIGALRPHVSVFHDDRTVHDLDASVADGARIVVLQAVSGGVASRE